MKLKVKMANEDAAEAIADAVESRDKDKLDDVQDKYGEAYVIPTFDELLAYDWKNSAGSFPDSSMEDVSSRLEPIPPPPPPGSERMHP